MKVVVITEGESEYACLPKLESQIMARTELSTMKVLKLNVQPDGPPAKIARSLKEKLFPMLVGRFDLVILLIDREQQSATCGTIASQVQAEIVRLCGPALPIKVALKDRSFENWVIADLEALHSQSARYRITRAHRAKVEPNKADGTDALRLLNDAAVGASYDKVKDGVRWAHRTSVARMALHSRSFRHLLHILGDHEYSTQCRTPVGASSS